MQLGAGKGVSRTPGVFYRARHLQEAAPVRSLKWRRETDSGRSSTFLARVSLVMLLTGALLFALSVPASASDIKGDPAAARDKISNCTGCHGIKGYRASFPSVYRVPRIAGQTEKYIANALIAYRKGDRDHPTMRAMAGTLSDQDIADLAAFYAQSD